jgi:ABC-2 type transport system permease protein
VSVSYKEILHIVRDWRIMLLLIIFPPLFALMIGSAFEVTELSRVPAILRDDDRSAESEKFSQVLSADPTFAWRKDAPPVNATDLLHAGVQAIVVIPPGWGASLNNGDPIPIQATLDGTDTTTASALEGVLGQALGNFQLTSRQEMVDNLPEEVIALGKQIPVDFRNRIVSSMAPWTIKSEILYNPKLRFIDFVTPGIVGLILQLLTVTLMAVTITREREAGTFSQLMLTSLRRWEIIVGKVLPYLGLSLILILIVLTVIGAYFGVKFSRIEVLSIICFLFLICSLGLGLLISALCNTQAQAIQFAVFFMVPVIPLSGAFAPLEQLPIGIRYVSEVFPLTHFCRAFRLINLSNAELSFIAADVIVLALGALVTCIAASLLLRRSL